MLQLSENVKDSSKSSLVSNLKASDLNFEGMFEETLVKLPKEDNSLKEFITSKLSKEIKRRHNSPSKNSGTLIKSLSELEDINAELTSEAAPQPGSYRVEPKINQFVLPPITKKSSADFQQMAAEHFTPDNLRLTESHSKINEELEQQFNQSTFVLDSNRSLNKLTQVYDSISDEEDLNEEEPEKKRFLIDLDSRFKRGWDTLIVVVCVQVVLFAPLVLAFPRLENELLYAVEVGVDVIFCLDLVLPFFMPFKDFEDNLVTDRKEIALNYLQTWFVFDLASSFPYSLIRSEGENEATSILKLAKIYRLLKLSKLFKLVKVAKKKERVVKFNFIEELDISEKKKRVTSFFLGFMLVAHALGCIWVFLASIDQHNWTEKGLLDRKSDLHAYVSATFFIMGTIFTTGYGDITPVNTIERVFTTLLMLIGVLVYSFTVSALGSIISKYDEMTDCYFKKLDIVERMKVKKSIPPKLYTKLVRFLRYDYKKNDYQRRAFIKELPKRLKAGIIQTVHSGAIQGMPFFASKDQEFISRVLLEAKPNKVIKGDYLVYEGDKLAELYLVFEGSLSLNLSVRFDEQKVCDLRKNQHFGDILLLSNQRVPVNLKGGRKHCELLCLKATDFESLVNDFPEIYEQIYAYSSSRFAILLKMIDKMKNKFIESHFEALTRELSEDDINELEQGKKSKILKVKALKNNLRKDFSKSWLFFGSLDDKSAEKVVRDSCLKQKSLFGQKEIENLAAMRRREQEEKQSERLDKLANLILANY